MSPSGALPPNHSMGFMELLDLQLDYWTTSNSVMKTEIPVQRKESKTSLKNSFKSVQVSIISYQ